MRFRLRTLLIVLAIGPMVLAIVSTQYWAWRAELIRLSQPIPWMIGPYENIDYSQIPQTVGEFEAQSKGKPVYIGIDGTMR